MSNARNLANLLNSSGVLTADAGLKADNITIDGTEIDLSSGDLTVDVAGDIILDADSDGSVRFKDGGTEFAHHFLSSNTYFIQAPVSNGDVIIRGNDGGSNVDALTFDMSDAGNASFNGTVTANAGVVVDNITIDGTEIDLSSGDLTLDVAGDIILDADGNKINFKDGGTSIGVFQNSSSDFKIEARVQDKDIIFAGNDGGSGIEAMRIDMSEGGNLLIGTTASTDPATNNVANGIRVAGSNGRISASADGTQALNLNRKTDDGDIAIFRKDGTSVGSIGIQSSGFTIDGESGHAGLRFGGADISPRDGGADADNAIQLGSSSFRFTDLYLSGGIYVGGTGSANYLDDYEEGTWTPTFVNFDGTMTINIARYTKIGRLVTYELRVSVPSTSDGDAFQYTLPFTPIDDEQGAFITFQQKGLEVLITGNSSIRHRLRDFSGNNRTYAQFSSSTLNITGVFNT